MSELTERIFSACCPDSTIDDLFEHAARICEVVTAARRPPPAEAQDDHLFEVAR